MAVKHLPTLADFAAIAIGPILIMFLVGSLNFFLLEVAYAGEASLATRWVLAWFTIGIVLISRLAIEQGSAVATGYGAMLAAAVAIVLGSLTGCLLLAVAWWCAHKLTWDCTVIDDRQDSSGEGLLDAAGVPLDQPAAAHSETAKTAAEEKRPTRPKTAFDKFLDWMNSEDKKAHAPGVWVLYFSLAALPLFGVGEMFIAREAQAVRTSAFQYLFLYTAAALALLVTTSFLGLRRYLRQRKIDMPTNIAATWIGGGAALIIGVMVAALVVPRPYSETSITAWLDRQSQGDPNQSNDAGQKRDASDYAVVKGESGQGDGRRIGEGDKPEEGQNNGESSDNKANSDKGATSTQSGQQPATAKGDSQNSGGQSSKSANNSGGSSQNQSPPNQSNQSGSQQNQSPNNSGSQSGDKNAGSQNSPQSKSPNASPNPGKRTLGGDRSSSGDKSSSGGQQQGQKQGDQNNQDQRSQDQSSDSNSSRTEAAKPPEHKAQQQSPTNGSWMKNAFGDIGRFIALIVKWSIYILLALAGLYVLWTYGADIVDGLAKLWADLMAWLFGLTGAKPPAKKVEESGPIVVGPSYMPFAAYRDPFRTGEAAQMNTPQLLAYTFEASQAWARERGLNDRTDRTPLEFAGEAARQFPDAAAELPSIAQVYASMLYGSRVPSEAVRAALERLWMRMSQRQPVAAP